MISSVTSIVSIFLSHWAKHPPHVEFVASIRTFVSAEQPKKQVTILVTLAGITGAFASEEQLLKQEPITVTLFGIEGACVKEEQP